VGVGGRARAGGGARNLFLCFPDMLRTPSFFLLDFRERFLVSLALELPCVLVLLNEKHQFRETSHCII